MPDYKDREEQFKHLLEHWPEPGDILECLKGEPAQVTIRGSDSRRVMFTSAVIDDDCTGWYLSLEPRGVKVMIDLASHDELLQRLADWGPEVTVKRLRVIRRNVRDTALICELVGDDDDDDE